MFCKGDPTKSGYLTVDIGGMSAINCGTLYQESDSNKVSRGKTKILKRPAKIIPK